MLDTQRIIALLKSKGKNQAGLSVSLGISPQRVGQLLQEKDCRVSQLIIISEYLEVEPEDLISKEYYLRNKQNKKEYINTRMKLIFNELADTITTVIDESYNNKEFNNSSIEYFRLSCALECLLQSPKPYHTPKDNELNNILNETQSAYETTRDKREKELLKYLQERIEREIKKLREEGEEEDNG